MPLTDEERKQMASCDDDEPCDDCTDAFCPMHYSNDEV